MKLVVLHPSQLTVNDCSAYKRSGINLVLSSPTYPPTLPRMSGDQANGRGRWQVAAADASDLVGIRVSVTNASYQSGAQAASSSNMILPSTFP